MLSFVINISLSKKTTRISMSDFFKSLIPVLILFLVSNCSFEKSSEVVYFGALKNAMKQNDLTVYVSSDTIDLKNFYALGALEGLKGELLIMDGQVYTSSQGDTTNNSLDLKQNINFSANFLVGAKVSKWISLDVPKTIKTKSDLEKFVSEKAIEQGFDKADPFPFLLEGPTKSTSWHVVNWDANDSTHTHEKHVKSGIYDTDLEEDVIILGFYSEHHKGIFTHHSSFLHMHVLNDKKAIMGHLDDLTLGEKMILKLPK